LGSSFTADLGADSLDVVELALDWSKRLSSAFRSARPSIFRRSRTAIRAILKQRRGEAA